MLSSAWGAYLVNSLEERFAERYHPMGDRGPRSAIIWGALQEVRAGRGPIYMDCRHLSRQEREHLFTTLGYDKDTLPDFLIKKGYNLEGTMIEMTLLEPCRPVRRAVWKRRENRRDMRLEYPGPLCSRRFLGPDTGCLHLCVAGGYAAGKGAAAYAKKTKNLRPLDAKETAAEKERIYKPLNRKGGLSSREFEDIVRIITTDHFGPIKSELSLNGALEKLNRLDGAIGELGAQNLHELMRVHEAVNIQQVAESTATAALARKETRFAPYHYRTDYPETDDKNFSRT